MSITISPHATSARVLMNQTADYYTAHATGGDWTVLSLSGIPIQLTHVPRRGQPVTESRMELAGEREAKWHPSYELPTDRGQFLVNGERWNVVPDTVGYQLDFDGRLVYRHCLVVRDTTS